MPKHHYIPVFYLKAWAGPDGRVCEYSRPYREVVKPHLVHPSGTGYIENLYHLPGLKKTHANIIESRFFSPIDNQAADAHRKMLHGASLNLTSAERSAWMRFVMSLLLRSPDDVRLLVEMTRQEFLESIPELERAYAIDHPHDDRVSLSEYLKQQNVLDYIDRRSLRMLIDFINHRGIGTHLINMIWSIITTTKSSHLFLTSDRPVVLTSGFIQRDSYILVPISPTKAFLAVNTRQQAQAFFRRDSSVLVAAVNRTVVSFAKRFVWGRSDSALGFVQREMSVRTAPTLMQIMTSQNGLTPP